MLRKDVREGGRILGIIDSYDRVGLGFFKVFDMRFCFGLVGFLRIEIFDYK